MKQLSSVLLMALFVAFGLKLNAQTEPPLHGIAAKLLFIDYGTPNSRDSLKISNGLEVAYIRNISPWLNIAIPGKIGLATVNNNDERTTFGSVDAVLQLQYAQGDSRFIPYALAGGGITFISGEDAAVQLPLGLGLNYRVGENAFINAQAAYRASLAEQRNNIQLGIGLHFRLVPNPDHEIPPPDADHDGIPDDLDKCPDIRGVASASGCPDRDGDGVEDAADACPKIAGSPANGGCPLVNAVPQTNDTDGDGIANDKDECPNLAGLAVFNGCPDTDGDGTPDKLDKCPGTPGLKENQGCPVATSIDSDGDGVTDDKDECPNIAGLIPLLGCPDSD
ncbi:MAG: OmpA family protein, partial [Bacteroidetes bacterium]